MAGLYVRESGVTVIGADKKLYVDSAQNFALDFEQDLPETPAEVKERIYEPEIRHAFTDGKGSVVGGDDRTWGVGDKIISKVDRALARQEDRRQEEKRLADEAQAQNDTAAQEEKERKAAEAAATAAATRVAFYADIEQRVRNISTQLVAVVAGHQANQGEQISDLVNETQTIQSRLATIESSLLTINEAILALQKENP